jgi:C-terminal processing protease CtpA/Prc
MKISCLYLTLAFMLPSIHAATGATFSPERIRRDLSFLYETLQASHYDLFVHTTKADYTDAYEQALGRVDRPLDPREAYRILQPFAALAGVAHCNVGLPFQTVYVPHVMQEGKVVPFDITFSDGKAFVWHNYSANLELKPGLEIIAIDKRPVDLVLDSIQKLISGDSAYLKRTSIEITCFPRLYWLAFGEAKTHTLTLRQANGVVSEHVVDVIAAMQFEQKAATHKPIVRTDREVRFIGDVAYLRPGVFLNNQSPADIANHQTFEKGEFVRFIDAAFGEIRAKKAASLIIDLRGNPGGDNSFSDPMIAYIADRPFRFCSRFTVKTSQMTKEFWRDVEEPALNELKREILSRDNGERFDVELPFTRPRSETERFRGRVYVLIDRFSYSNAVSVAAICQDYGFGIIVGEMTADLPTTYGAAHQFTLPNTGFTVMYPKAWIVRPNGDMRADGVKPDCEISDSVFTAEDEILLKALTLADNAGRTEKSRNNN